MKKTFKLSITVVMAMLATACLQEMAIPEAPAEFVSDDRVEVAVDFSSPAEEIVSVKSSLLNGSETVHSGATVYAYLVNGGVTVLDDVVTVPGTEVTGPGHTAAASSAKLLLRRNGTYNIYVVGNSWYINRITGVKACWSDAMGADLPEDYASGLASAVCRFDGSTFHGGYRHETMAEVKTYGLPYSGVRMGVKATDGGTVAITLGSDDRDVFLSFRDNGSGMDAEQLVNLFEPYRTTKEKGTGLGLMISKRIVTEHGGSIAAESKPGEGTTFTISLPRLERRIRALK